MYLSNVRLLVTNFQACYRFYRDVMGLTVTWGEDSPEEAYASFRVGDSGAHLALFRREVMAEALPEMGDQGGLQNAMLVFELPDRDEFDRTVRTLRERGADMWGEPEDHAEWGIRTAYVRDPEGNIIELETGLPREEMTPELQEEMDRYSGGAA